jgi:hypothetical protein
MRPFSLFLPLPFVLAGSLAVASCDGNNGGTRKGPCTLGELTGCGKACADDDACLAGLYCEDGKCSAECSDATVARDCGEGQSCSADGKCSGGAGDGDADGAGDGDGDADGAGDGDGGGDGDVCASIELKPTPTTPNVMFIIDQSGSMDAEFDNGKDRWDSLKDVLLADDGIIAELQDSVNFGVVLYTGMEGAATCPLLTTVNIAQNNLQGIRDVYGPAEYKNDTPTGDSIEAVLASDEVQALIADDNPNPTIFILASDGDPDRCEQLNPQNEEGKQESVDAITHAFSEGIRTYVVAVAQDNEFSEDHIIDLANAGVGMDGAPFFRVDNIADLESDLRGIVAGELSWAVPLHGMFTGDDPCVGTVKLSGTALTCNDANGWKLDGNSTLVIQGTACNQLKEGGSLTASFPCGTAIPDPL